MKLVFDIYKKYFMHHLKIFIELTRLSKPIGFMLLFWPCSWGLAYAFYFDQNPKKFLLLDGIAPKPIKVNVKGISKESIKLFK